MKALEGPEVKFPCFLGIVHPTIFQRRGLGTLTIHYAMHSSIQSVLQATREKSAEEMASDVRELLGGESPDVTIECSGVESSVRYMGIGQH